MLWDTPGDHRSVSQFHNNIQFVLNSILYIVVYLRLFCKMLNLIIVLY